MTREVHHYKLISASIIGVLVIVLVFWFIAHKNGAYETITVEPAELVRTIIVTGEVVPVDDVTLGFAASGRVSTVLVIDGQSVTRGQTLATLDAAEVQANIRQAIADRDVAAAELTALVGSNEAAGSVVTTKQQAVSVVAKALSVAETQVTVKVDTLFENPQSGRPQVTPAIKDYFARQAIGQQRVTIEKVLEEWRGSVAAHSVDSISDTDMRAAYANLEQVRSFFSSISQALSDAETTNQVTETRLSEFRTIVTAARTAIDTVMDEVVNAQDSLRDVLAQDPVQRARVTSASASIDRFTSLLSNYTLTSPFNGTVAEVFVTAGETVTTNQSVVSVVSEGTAELEVFVPEVHVAHLSVGDSAVVTLDAFGEDLRLGATVTFVDARATQKNGIVTYRTKLAFNDVPTGVRPGMTATIQIKTLVVPDVLIVPQAAVQTTADGSASVDVLTDEGRERRDITLGLTDTRGGVMVESGLVVGDQVIVGE